MIILNLFLSETFTLMILIFLYLIIFRLLKPFKFHTKRKNSTAALKFSYLCYLVILIFVIYKFIFFDNRTLFDSNGNMVNFFAIVNLVILLIGIVLPNLGIVIRRKIKNREPYNIFFTFINIFYFFYFLGLALLSKWIIKFVDA